MQLKRALQNGLNDLGLSLSSGAQEALLAYLNLLQTWNKAYNLTAIRDPYDMLVKHIFDSLSITPYVLGEQILDVGTGAGLPGIPLAICFPEKHFTLLDSNGKKMRFLTHVVHTLKLKNVTLVQARVEKYAASHEFDTIVCRAFSALDNIISSVKHLLSGGGQILAMKGVFSEEESRGIQPGFFISAVHALKVPELDAKRHLVSVCREQDVIPSVAEGS